MVETNSGQGHVSLPRTPENQKIVGDWKRGYREKEKRTRHGYSTSYQEYFGSTTGRLLACIADSSNVHV